MNKNVVIGNNKWNYLFLVLFALLTTSVFSQTKKEIKLINAENLYGDRIRGVDVRKLIGNVHLQHEGIDLFCDSAYIFPDNNIDAYSNVKILQGDSLDLRGEVLHYDEKNKTADLQRNVKLINKDLTLTTNQINYNIKTSTAVYNTGGVIVSKESNLTSQIGYYYSKTQDFYFKQNVVLTNPQYVINTDTLRYNSSTKLSYFLGPTHITDKGKEKSSIYCENGWYNQVKDISQFNKNAYIINKEQTLKGDSIYYDKKRGFGKAITNVSIKDSIQNIIVTGDYCEYLEKTGSSFVTGHAQLIQPYEKDTLFLHADTLRAGYETKDSAKLKIPDTKKRLMLAYYHVKFYKTDFQGKCDSLAYAYVDSLMRLYKDPIMWNEKSQLTAEKMEIKTGKNKLQQIILQNNAFVLSMEDSIRFNQIKGKKLTGYFNKENKLYKINVDGNGETIYYAKDKDALIGINKAESANMLILLKDNKPSKITFMKKPVATLFPPKNADPKEYVLRGMKNRFAEKPTSKNDIFKH